MKHAAKFFTLPLTFCGSLLASAALSQSLQPWMSPEVSDAWKQGYQGQNTHIKVIDDFNRLHWMLGKLGPPIQRGSHGEWTSKEASMIAPAAKMSKVDWTSTKKVVLCPGLNILNLSYSAYAPAGLVIAQEQWNPKEGSIIDHAIQGSAVVVKSAGNDSVEIGAANLNGEVDHLAVALKGTPSSIYVGALNKNGTVSEPATLAKYSNIPGKDTTVQKQFLAVGVEGHKTGLDGTSFAVPVITGYSAILGSKFTKAVPAQITSQLLNTARQDTIVDYNAAIHGRGEASISRALSPRSIK